MYLLDADVFIQSSRLFYGFDICPGFWQWLDQAHDARRVFSIEKVKEELRTGDDELKTWALTRPNTFFLKPTQETVVSFQAVSNWATIRSDQYSQPAISQFLNAADYYLIAQAHELAYTVVTQEQSAPLSKSRIKIPDACDGIAVQHMTLYDLLRAEEVRFVLR